MLLSPPWYLKRPYPFLEPTKNNIQRNTTETSVSTWLGKASRIFDNPFNTRFRRKPYFPVSIFVSSVLKKINKHILSCHPVLGETVKSKTKVFDVNFIFVSRVYDNHGPLGTHRHQFSATWALEEMRRKVFLFCCLLKRSEIDMRALGRGHPFILMATFLKGWTGCHSHLNSWPTENDLGLCMLEELRGKRTCK